MTNAYCDGGGDNVHQTYFYGSYVVGDWEIERWNYTFIYPEIQTTNMAEYKTFVLLLKYIQMQIALGRLGPDEEVQVFSDSQLMVKQINGEQKIYSERLLPLYLEAVALMGQLKNVKLNWVSRKVIVKVLGH